VETLPPSPVSNKQKERIRVFSLTRMPRTRCHRNGRFLNLGT